jgi:hypothetical protein
MSAIARSPAAGHPVAEPSLSTIALRDRTGCGLGELSEFLQDALTTPPTDVCADHLNAPGISVLEEGARSHRSSEQICG